MVDHDDDGDITHVRSWQEWTGHPAPAGTAMPLTPFTRNPEYDLDESVLGSHPVGEVIVLETFDRAGPSLAGSDAPAQSPHDVAKAVDAITADVVDSHRFGYRGRLSRSDWVESTSHESAAQTYTVRLGMARYYGSMTAVVHGRTAVQAVDRATEHHRTWYALGAHVQVEDPCAWLQRAEHIDPLHGFSHRGNIVANDAQRSVRVQRPAPRRREPPGRFLLRNRLSTNGRGTFFLQCATVVARALYHTTNGQPEVIGDAVGNTGGRNVPLSS